MKIIFARALACLLLLLAVGYLPAKAETTSLIHDGDRIVVVGDSITGQSNGDGGYVGLMREGLGKAHPGTKTIFIPLGGSGHSVGSWLGMEKDSRDKHFKLDVPDIDVKDTLDGGADVVTIMLGMNNVLRPDMDDSAESIANWTKMYRELVVNLRERTKARVIALAPPTMCTEDESSVKNKLMDQFAVVIAKIADEEKCVVLPVRDKYKAMFREARTYRYDYHLADDMVHPNPTGHLAIAMGMLEGLGEPAAAKAIYDARIPKAWESVAGKLPGLSYTLDPLPSANVDDQATFKVHFWLTTQIPRPANYPAKVQLSVPEGWTVTPASVDNSTGEFTITGPLDHLRNNFNLSASHDNTVTKAEIMIPAPWRIGIGNIGQKGWVNKNGFNFDPVEGKLPEDEGLTKGLGFDQPLAGSGWGRPLTWKRYIASVNYTGGNDPGSIDHTAVAWFGTFDISYGVRWIYSPVAKTVPVKIDSHTFAGGHFLSLWLNGSNLWESAQRTTTFDIKLEKGWNALVFKSNHLEWQWQFEIQLLGSEKDDLSDLRFSIVPHETGK